MIVLDTHAWLWWQGDPKKLSKRSRSAVDEADRIGISPISCWELATLVRRERVGLTIDLADWIEQALRQDRVELIPITPAIAVKAGSLAIEHGDPADRILLATAMRMKAALVTKDRKLRGQSLVKTIW